MAEETFAFVAVNFDGLNHAAKSCYQLKIKGIKGEWHCRRRK